MSPQRIAGYFVVYLLLVLSSSGRPGLAQAAIVKTLSIEGDLKAAGVSFSLSLGCEDRDISEVEGDLHGYSGTKKGCVMTAVALEFSGDPVDIPESAYLDLLNPIFVGGMSIRERDSELVVSIAGGDGESGYEARLVFRGATFDRREIVEMNEEGERIELVERFSEHRGPG